MTRATKKKRRETGNEREKTNERQLRAKKKQSTKTKENKNSKAVHRLDKASGQAHALRGETSTHVQELEARRERIKDFARHRLSHALAVVHNILVAQLVHELSLGRHCVQALW